MAILSSLNLDTIILLSLVTLVILLVAEIFRLNSRLKKFMIGRNGANLEDTIKEIINAVNDQDTEIEDIEKVLENMNGRLKKSIQKVHTVRFNPFQNQGSNQSFSTAFLNEEGDGVVISSLYSRDKIGIYAKPVASHKSEYELSDEEKQSIDTARQK